MAGDLTFHVRPSNDGLTLASALRKMLTDLSWGEIKRLVATRRIHVNGNLAMDEGRKLKAGDVLHVFEHSRAPLPTSDDIVIRYFDAHLVVIEKPAGLTTLRHHDEQDLPQKRKDKAPTLEELLQPALARAWHGGRGFSNGSAVATAGPASPVSQRTRSDRPSHPLFRKSGDKHGADKRPSKATRHSAPPDSRAQVRRSSQPPARKHDAARPHAIPVGPVPAVRAVHRLDRDTSGLMIFALSAAAEVALERDFARHAVDRRYRAVVHGRFQLARTIETWIVRDRGDGLRGSSPLGAKAQSADRALTHIRPIEQLGNAACTYTLVECRLETGRTHQIRIHLSELGHRLCGEKTYTHPPGIPPMKETSGAPRHALHSAELRFTHPITGGAFEFFSEFPHDLATWFNRLRQSNTMADT